MTSIVMEEFELLGDSKYRSYMSLVDKALKSFEYTAEWADLIAALGKLSKVIGSHSKYCIIPRRVVIAKRLAQCMHPALPSGVHLKALETYDIIFRNMGKTRLSEDLFLYSAGLFPLLGHAAMHVRPVLLELYETHFLPLHTSLRPALNGLLCGILPGLEEGSDHHERTNQLLERLCHAVQSQHFYISLWQCVLTNPAIRLPAITFALAHVTKRHRAVEKNKNNATSTSSPVSPQAANGFRDELIFGSDVDLVVKAVCESVQDVSVLVQRHALDLLLTVLPLHEDLVNEESKIELCAAACVVLLRRDMSLNRRLFNWLLGVGSHVSRQESVSSTDKTLNNAYFDFYVKQVLVQGICRFLKRSVDEVVNDPSLDRKPYRVLISLIEKPEIGDSLVDDVLIHIFRAIFHTLHGLRSKNKDGDVSMTVSKENKVDKTWKTREQEVMKNANLLFASFESGFIWEYLGKNFETSMYGENHMNDTHLSFVNSIGCENSSISEMCVLTECLLDVFSIETYVEMHSEHLPKLFVVVTSCLRSKCKQLSASEVTAALNLCKHILSKVQPAFDAWDAARHVDHNQTEPSLSSKSSPALTRSETTMKESSNDTRGREHHIRIHEQHEQLMKQCGLSFQELFVALISERFVSESIKSVFYEYLVDNIQDVDREVHSKELDLIPKASEMEEAIITSCKILVDLSSVPTISSRARVKNQHDVTDEEETFPQWLQGLLVCSSFLDAQHSLIQLNCIASLIEMLGLLQSNLSVLHNTMDVSGREHQVGNVVIVMLPLISQHDYNFIVKETRATEVITYRLWQGLNDMEALYHPKCVTLLHQLHNLTPSPKTVECIVAKSLSASESNADAYHRFTLLWHLSRDLDLRASTLVASGNRRARTFDICLLKMLDNLNLASCPLKALTQSWLVHALARGDIGRLMEPLLLTLLDPSTARVSVLHAFIELFQSTFSGGSKDNSPSTPNNTSATDEKKEKKPKGIRVYTLTLSNKEELYHFSSGLSVDEHPDLLVEAKRLIQQTRSRQQANYEANNVDALSVSSSHAGLNVRGKKGDDLSSMPLSINPFALVPPEVDEYDSFTKGYKDVSDGSQKYSSRSSSSSEDASSLYEIQGSEKKQGRVGETRSLHDEHLEKSLNTPSISSSPTRSVHVHPLHSHLLLLNGIYDSKQIIYTLQSIANIINTNPRLVICTLATTSLTSNSSSRTGQIQTLLARHRKSVFGKSFIGSLTSDNLATYRNVKLLEVLITTLLYFIRSYYPNLGQRCLSEADIRSNREVQLMSIDILARVVSELTLIVQDNNKAFAHFVSELFSRCKVQKVILHSLLAGVNDMRDKPKRAEEEKMLAFTDDILNFNEVPFSSGSRISSYAEAFQVQVLRLLLSLIMLEQAIMQQIKGGGSTKKGNRSKLSLVKNKSLTVSPSGAKENSTNSIRSNESGGSTSHVLRYHPDHVIPDQPMFLAAVVSALGQCRMRHLHSHWTSMITACLPFLGKALSQTALEVSNQLIANLENLAPLYASIEDRENANANGANNDGDSSRIPADYVLSQLEALSVIYHFCLLSHSNHSQPNVSLAFSKSNGDIKDDVDDSDDKNESGENSLSHVLHAFLATSDTTTMAAKALQTSTSVDTMTIAKKIILSTLPKLLHSIVTIWGFINGDNNNSNTNVSKLVLMMGSASEVRRRLLELLSPIAHHHPLQFMAAVMANWSSLRPSSTSFSSSSLRPPMGPKQAQYVSLVSQIRTLPVSKVMETLREVLKAPSSSLGCAKSSMFELSTLEFFFHYLSSSCSESQIFESWSTLASLLKDCLLLKAPSVLLAFSILNEFVQRCPNLSDKREHKELQELATKLVEACVTIGSACLEQTTWLRRNLAVNPDLQREIAKVSEVNLDATKEKKQDASLSKKALYAINALDVLGCLLAPLMDIIYESDEKERALPLFTAVVNVTVPYLKNHSRENLASYRACSRLLASLSEYQYTRKAWKKEGMELLLDTAFFQTDLPSLRHWKTTVDSLMTHDKTTIKELMTKVASLSQSGSLNLFSSKEQELEQRALLLKRLAFVLFCSELDHYQKQMPDIQERLTESLRIVPSSPGVQSAVFLCFRVILVRVSSQHLTSLWPLIITEMVQIFSYLEQELLADSDKWSSHLKRLSALDTSWVVNSSSNGLEAHNSPSWLALYLNVCKLLDQCLLLPAQTLPQFQMYRWAFVKETDDRQNYEERAIDSKEDQNTDDQMGGARKEEHFVPYVVRVAKILLEKTVDPLQPPSTDRPQLKVSSITSLDDLAAFFRSICSNAVCSTIMREQNAFEAVNRVLENDFLEELARND